jgi:kynurenine formamidase
VNAVPDWVQQLADEHLAELGHDGARHGPCDGTLRYITPQARRRGLSAVRQGECVSLGRPLQPGPPVRAGETRPAFVIETFAAAGADHATGSDRIEIDCHGLVNTHLDGLTHIGLDGRWHGGQPAVAPDTGDSADLLAGAATGISTHAVCLDIPALRGSDWVDSAVEADELDAAAAGLDLQSGDAVLIYMGRDAFEASGRSYGPVGEHPDGRAGLGHSGARWLAEHEISVLCWDFLDAHIPGRSPLPAHMLSWATGLILIDNCHLGPAARALAAAGQHAGLLTVGPLKIHGATGSAVNPVLLY